MKVVNLICVAMVGTVLFLLSGCRSSKHVAGTVPDVVVGEAAWNEKVTADMIKSGVITAKMGLELSIDGKSISVSGNCNFKKDEVIQLSLVLLRVAPQVRAIEQENMISGEYSKVSNVEYALEGYGTLKVNVFADDGKFATITLFPINGGSVAMDVVAKEPVSTSDMTQLLCRTWYPETCEMKEWENDRLVWHGMLDFAKKEVIKYVTLDGEHFEGDEWLQKVIFSKSGTYTCYYEDDFDMASWYWVDETTGQFGYYWGEGDSETGDLPSGGVDMPTVDTPTLEESVEKKNIYDERDVVYVSFYGNKMKVTEESYYYAYLGIAYKSTSITTLRAAE